MIIIGEKINSSIASAKAMIEAKDQQAIINLAKAQQDAGAMFIDINAGMFLDKEGEMLAFIAETLKDVLDVPFSVDTPSTAAAAEALKTIGPGRHLINSITAQPERLETMSSLAAEYGCGVVALCMQATKMPENTESRLKIADILIETLTKKGVKLSDIYIDPMLRPLGSDDTAGTDALDAIRRLRAIYPACHIVVGLSNLSFGLPSRRTINRAFAVAGMSAGLDAVIADPLDRDLMGLIAATNIILGQDEFCMEYLGKFRSGKIG
jgi:5-methyltetrahydrofolate--homocysteine methyltransferase